MDKHSMLDAFIAAFLATFLSEVADKTQLVLAGLAVRYRSPLQIFLGALLAHSFMDVLAIVAGSFFGFEFPKKEVSLVVGTLFIVLGIWKWVGAYKKKSDKEEKTKAGSPFIVAFLLIAVSEFGDKTQIAAALLAAQYLAPLTILAGVVLALILAIGLNVFLLGKLAQKLPRKTMQMLTAALFILFGILSFM